MHDAASPGPYKKYMHIIQSKHLHRKKSFWLSILILVILAFFLFKLGFLHGKKGKLSPPARVVVATAYEKDVPIYLNALGGVTPTYSVTLITQIDGLLTQVLFREGQMVKKGDLLAVIDDRPYQAQLIQYNGQLERDQALLDNARIDLKRYETLWKQNSVSQQVLATQRALVKQDEGTVQIDAGLIEATKLNIQYCYITSPIDGRVGLRLVDPGNFVQTSNTTGIAVLNTLNPITVIFTIPEDNIDDVLQTAYTDKTMTVEVYDRQQKTLLNTGKLLTMDNQVDPTTGTVKLRAQFQNDQNQLFPDQFVNVRLLIKTIKNATLVPTAAVQFIPQGNSYVYVFNKDQTVTTRVVKLGVTSGDYTIITAGLKAGESVVTEGADKLTDGATVMLAKSPAPSSALPATPQSLSTAPVKESNAKSIT